MNDSLLAIDEMIEDYSFISMSILMEEPSMAQRLERHLKKMFVLSCASCYETTITNALKSYAQAHSVNFNSYPHCFSYLGGFSFFKMFDFGRDKLKEARAFLSPLASFGYEFKEILIEEVKSNAKLEQEMKSFQEMCCLRNSLAHNDLISMDDAIKSKTFSDVEFIHKNAIEFVKYFVSKFPLDYSR